MSKPYPWLTLRQAARYLGWEGHFADLRLRRQLLAVERQTGKRILIRAGSGTRKPTYRVTLPILRRWLPEAFASRDGLPDTLQRALDELEVRIVDGVKRDHALGAAIRTIRAEIRDMKAAG